MAFAVAMITWLVGVGGGDGGGGVVVVAEGCISSSYPPDGNRCCIEKRDLLNDQVYSQPETERGLIN